MSEDPSPLLFEQVVAPKLGNHRARRRWRRWSWKRNWPILVLFGALIGGWVLYAVIWPPLEIRHKIATSQWKYSPGDIELSIPVRFMLRSCEYLFVFWFFYLGASIGSFINVVASRTPQGKTIVSRGSHCPYCDRPLNMLDNSPVFGWVALRGRCRTCHLPISPRYLIMEILVGSMFMILAVVELIGNGRNLPHRDWSFGSGIVATVFYPRWELIGAYVAHCSLLAVAMMLIGSHRDGLRFPRWPLVILGGIFLASVTANRVLCPVKWTEPFAVGFPTYGVDVLGQCVTAIVGACVGLVLGGALAVAQWFLLFPRGEVEVSSELGEPTTIRERSWNEFDRTAYTTWISHSSILMILAGTLLGWQAAVTVGLVSMMLTGVVLRIARVQHWTWLADDPELRPQVLALVIWTTTLFVHHCFWRQIAHGLAIG